MHRNSVDMSNTEALIRSMTSTETKLMNDFIKSAESGTIDVMNSLLQENEGFDLTKCKGMKGYGLLHYAASRGHADILIALLQRGLPISSFNDAGETALHTACHAGSLSAVEVLLEFGIDLDARNHLGETALFYAARQSSLPITRLLLQHGADSTIKDSMDDLALDHVKDENIRRVFADVSIGCGEDHLRGMLGVEPAVASVYVKPSLSSKTRSKENVLK